MISHQKACGKVTAMGVTKSLFGMRRRFQGALFVQTHSEASLVAHGHMRVLRSASPMDEDVYQPLDGGLSLHVFRRCYQQPGKDIGGPVPSTSQGVAFWAIVLSTILV